MVKSIIKMSASVLVVCFIGVVGANKLAGASLEGSEEIGIGESIGLGRGGLGIITDEALFEELSFRGYGGLGGLGRGGYGRPGLGGFGPGPVRRPPPFSRRGHLRRPPLEAIGGVGGVGAIGGIGAVEGKEAALDGIKLDSRNRDHNEIEGSQGGLVAAGKKFDAGQQTNLRNNNDAIHSHTGFDNDKVFLKEHNRGSNDLDVIHNSNDLSSGSHVGKASGILAAQGSQGRLENDRDRVNSVGALNAREKEFGAAGAAGAIGAAGAGGALI